MDKIIKLSKLCNNILKRSAKSPVCALLQCRNISLTSRVQDIMEFFDNPKNWGEVKIVHGRPWRMEELRLKSNKELHQLWYILLKERNMIMTMEEEYCHQNELYSFPNPERLEKVEESMENLMWVIEERNKAVAQLEEGEWNGPSIVEDMDVLGRPGKRLTKEHEKPYSENVGHSEFMWNFVRERLLREERETFMRSAAIRKGEKIMEKKQKMIKDEDTVKVS